MRGPKPALRQDAAAVADVPRAPTWLTKDAKAEWRRIMPLLVERRILTDADMGSVENYCLAIGQVRIAQRTIDADGLTTTTATGLRAHPAVKIQSDAMTRARLLAAELGLTPVSRSRPSIREDQTAADDADLGL
ncbi:phage terminase small subunit P27 family [Methylopila sp. 73B]|uniref:phage terminase small subunit P27 family n=1 Tax=Methylopila sp. 73B TaxID=1120792 RepID=UPI00037B0EEC|nr:phage terminase small subunit P27 family [Methylopila sp. 73B]